MTTATSQQAADATVRAMNAGLAGERLSKSPLTFTPAQIETINAVYEAAQQHGRGGLARPALAPRPSCGPGDTRAVEAECEAQQ